MTDLSELFAQERGAQPLVSGKWFEIRITPDLVTDERLNIGVAFMPARGGLAFRLLDSATPFVRLYGKAAREQFDFLLKATASALKTHGASRDISPHISYGKPRFAQGNSVREIIDHLFSSTVTLSRIKAEADEPRSAFTSLDSAEVANVVYAAMRERNALEANKLISGGDFPLVVEADDGPHELRFALRNAMRLGAITSAWYRKPDPAAANVKSALLDLGVAARAFSQTRGGLFILKPDTTALPDEGEQRQLDNVIDMAEWKAKKFGVQMCCEMEPGRLAEHILEWGLG